MNGVLEIAVSNAVMAGGLAVLVYAFSLFCNRPALVHGLWLLVLVKLVTPPVFAIPVPLLGRPSAEPAAPAQPERSPMARVSNRQALVPTVERIEPDIEAASEPEFGPSEAEMALDWDNPYGVVPQDPDAFAAPPLPPGDPPFEVAWGEAVEEPVAVAAVTEPRESEPVAAGPSLPLWRIVVGVLLGVWLAGTLSWFMLAGIRIRRFQRLLQFAQPAPPKVQQQAARLARQLGLRRCPRVELVPGAISPMLWWTGGTSRLLFPADLLARLEPAARDSLLLHELAHFQRRDHWVRLLELVVTGLYWWHPVVWWARRELEKAEEECCDAWVVAHLPGGGRPYATALLETLDFLSESRQMLPPAASGMGELDFIKRRLTMIMQGTTPKQLSAAGRLAVLLVAAILLPLLPTRAETSPAEERGTVAAEDRDVGLQEAPEPAAAAGDTPPLAPPLLPGLVGLGEPTEFATQPASLQFTPRYAWSSTYSPDGKWLVTGYGHWQEPGVVRLWDVGGRHGEVRVQRAAGRPHHGLLARREPVCLRELRRRDHVP